MQCIVNTWDYWDNHNMYGKKNKYIDNRSCVLNFLYKSFFLFLFPFFSRFLANSKHQTSAFCFVLLFFDFFLRSHLTLDFIVNNNSWIDVVYETIKQFHIKYYILTTTGLLCSDPNWLNGNE